MFLANQVKDSERILLSGAGGGFDIYSGIPLYFYLKALGKEVILGNLSFSYLAATRCQKIGPTGFHITPDAREIGYFPEKYLAEWFNTQNHSMELIAFEKTGVQPLLESYQAVVDRHEIDTLILVDGGTDSLMRGDESGLGTPIEDAISIVAGSLLQVDKKILTCIGFGIDHFHGVCHGQFLENVAEQIQKGGYLGSFSVTQEDEGGRNFLSLMEYANSRAAEHESIVANSIASALEGQFGDYHATSRTRGSQLFINPLMSLYWFFELEKISSSLLYGNLIEHTHTTREVHDVIDMLRTVIPIKSWTDIPL